MSTPSSSFVFENQAKSEEEHIDLAAISSATFRTDEPEPADDAGGGGTSGGAVAVFMLAGKQRILYDAAARELHAALRAYRGLERVPFPRFVAHTELG